MTSPSEDTAMFALDDDDDQERARRRWNAMIDDVDREIRDEATPEYQAERAEHLARIAKWSNLPPVRRRLGVPTARLTDDEAALLDREGL